MDDDSASIRSFVPTVAAGDDLEAMLSEMLGSETRWRLEQEQDENDNIDLWEDLSEDDSDSDLEENGHEDNDGIQSTDCGWL